MWAEMTSARGAIPTEFMPSFDRALYGTGPRRGELYVIQAVPKAGKSMFMVNFGANALNQGFRVLHITIGDLKEFDVAHRYASKITGIPMKQILTERPAYIAALRNTYLEQNRLRIKYYSPYTLTATHIRSYMSWLRATKGFQPDMLIVDYPDKMLYDRSNTYGELGRIYMELKQILDDFNCVGWVASQSNRGARYAGLNTTENMAESWDKVANADGIIPITRMDTQGKEIKETDEAGLNFDGPRRGYLTAYVENVRFGHDGFQIKIEYDFTTCYLHEDSPYTRANQITTVNMAAAESAVTQGVAPQPVQAPGVSPSGWVGPSHV
jgi:KaiC/GvpD/RAD55 family RecA-like ATPase